MRAEYGQLGMLGLAAGIINAAGFVLDGNIVTAASVLVATVAITLGVVNWVDKRIDHKLRNHANLEGMRFNLILRELRNIQGSLNMPQSTEADLQLAQTKLTEES